MVKSGLEFMAIGNIGAARLMFQPAAEAGDTVAAFALAETYDPAVLKKLGTKGGITPDIRLANSWYEKAGALGSTLAREPATNSVASPSRPGPSASWSASCIRPDRHEHQQTRTQPGRR